MPDRVKTAVFSRLHAALQPAAAIAPQLKPQERSRIDEILRATVPGYALPPTAIKD